jgi:succinate dehydrogenase hydrophobic membrane anchor protein
MPDIYNAKVKVFGFIVFGLLEWALAIPVIFHALNGGRLILYESFGCRNDSVMVSWVLGLSLLYILVLGFLMIIGNQSVSTLFFWLTTLLAACCVTWAALRRIWVSPNSLFWKIQRITGAYLLVMIPAHMLFMHLNTGVAHNAQIVLMRMSSPFIKVIDLSLILAVVYHGAYGVTSVLGDYISPRILTTIATGLAVIVMLFFAFTGVRLIFLT